MATDSYTLPFLEQLGESFTDHDMEILWQNRHFLLVRTENFSQNWAVVPDDNGIFVMPSGSNGRVEPQAHYKPYCRITIRSQATSREESFGYEAITFGNVVYQLWLSRCATNQSTTHVQVLRRRFIQGFVKKLPESWRDVIIHEYAVVGAQPIKEEHAINWGVHDPSSHPEHIRLVSLQPSISSYSPIRCTMFEADLADSPGYEALSYVWGFLRESRSVEINGSEFLVTKNLESALRQFRPRGTTPRILWFDAIYINQSDSKERTQQVQQMETVYRAATSVLVWLGEESITSGRLFNTFDMATEHAKKNPTMVTAPALLSFPFETEPYCGNCDTGLPIISKEEIKLLKLGKRDEEALITRINQLQQSGYESKAESIQFVEGLVKLLRRPWWRRVWVLQEVILGKEVIIHCGPRSVHWEVLQFVLCTEIRQARRARLHHTGGFSHRSAPLSDLGITLLSNPSLGGPSLSYCSL